MMSTEHDYSPGSPQHTWLEVDLQAAVNNRHNVPWIVLIGKHARFL